MQILNLVLIAFICVLTVDKSGVVLFIKKAISFAITRGKMQKTDYILKPVDCSLCMTWWTGLIYLLCIRDCTLLNITVLLILSIYGTKVINNLLDLLECWWDSIMRKLVP